MPSGTVMLAPQLGHDTPTDECTPSGSKSGFIRSSSRSMRVSHTDPGTSAAVPSSTLIDTVAPMG